METIFAPATARGRGGVAVIRISGARSGAALETLSGKGPGLPRFAELRELKDPESTDVLDQALVLYFAGPHSFTGEDVVELHLHGGLAVVDSVVRGLGKIAGLRLAEPGEFSRRAVENGKFDLSAAEGIADLIEAETSAQQAQALRQMKGSFGALCDDWRDQLVRSLAYVEADIDFADGDLPEDLAASVLPGLTALHEEMSGFLADHRGERIRDGIFVAVVGPANAGKSSLVNALARRDAVIVSDEAGTTRDVVEVRLKMAGLPVTVCDTAGLREGVGAIEQEGIRRARRTAEEADLRVWMQSAEDASLDFFATAEANDLKLVNKVDLGGSPLRADDVFEVSIKTGAGVGQFEEALERRIEGMFGRREEPVITRARHRRELSSCASALDGAITLLRVGGETALVAEELRHAARAVGRITGRVDVEELLDVVFRDFCIGK
ncbi:tRNA uridine-5-carboxymethylaminomethyl(34) synthesis GTPase MnmE [Parvibaculaceae bacterium PLY_AMNH_Bact1]|nr:tRNA uridine-5-carboxymethylaminomethyl(34) synthesis GTPase MnmE [Parvibaculaceae bacterium PLY_AMNH_Bact1]